jgi:DNA mismatch repair protein MutS2
VERSVASELEFDKVLQLVAAHARTGVGRAVVKRLSDRAEGREAYSRNARFTIAVHDLLEDEDAFALAGIDEALPWLEEDSLPPSEPRDLLALLTLARRVAAVARRLESSENELLMEFARRLPDTADLVAEVAPLLGRDGTVSDSASPELARLRREITRTRSAVVGELEGVRRANREIVTDAPPTMRRDRYCLPVRSSARSQMEGLLLDVSARGATSFVEPFAVVELNNKLTAAMAGERAEIQRILRRIIDLFSEAREDLADAAEVLGELDAIQARVLFGRSCDGLVVVPGEGRDLVLRGARHPLLDERLHGLRLQVFSDAERRNPDHQVVPLDFRMPEGVGTLVVSGPNAGGKTVVLKTLGLMVLMCNRGIPLPVDEGTAVPLFTDLWCHIGDEQDVAADLSTFSGAMAATARLLEGADDGTLVLFDELGAGTDPLEGAALGCALLEELTGRVALTVVSTHLAAIALTASSTDTMENAAMEYDENSERPTYNLNFGRPGRSRALEIADRMGVSRTVLDRARELLGGDHLELDRWLGRLEALEQELEEERSEVAVRLREAESAHAKAGRELERLEMERRELPQKLATEREELRSRAKKKLDTAISKLKKAEAEREAIGRRRLQKLRDDALKLDLPGERVATVPSDGLVVGARVRVALGGAGTLRELRGSRAKVDVAGKHLWVPVNELEILTGPGPKTRAAVHLEATEQVDRELNLIGLDSERAREDLERFLDQAFTAGSPSVRVVHGHGAGILRSMVAEVCRSHPAVRGFKHPPRHLGGTGATEVEIDQGA